MTGHTAACKYNEGGMMLKVCEEKCDQCLFSPNRIVSAARMKQILSDCRQRDSHFICHKSEDTCCRGFYDTQTSNLIRIMQRLNGIKFVAPTKGE